MTPEAAAALLGLADRYGLPLILLGAMAWLFLTRRIVTGRELAEAERRYEREREDRISAQKALADFGPANQGLAEAVADLSRVVMTDPYAERLTGPRRG